QVSTDDEIKLREWWVGRHVLLREDAHLPDCLVYLVGAVRLNKEASKSFCGDGGGCAVHALPCLFSHVLVYVCGEDLDWRLDAGIVLVLEEMLGYGIDLFTS